MTRPAVGRRVFLSYAQQDLARVQVVIAALTDAGITITNRDPVKASTTESVQAHLSEAIRASDILIVLFSAAAASSSWVNWEIAQIGSGKLGQRGVDIIPVRLDDTPLPDALATHHAIDLTRDVGTGVRTLVRQITAAQSVDFKRLDPRTFEALVGDVLVRLGFDVDRGHGLSAAGADMRAGRITPDPFGVPEQETWLVECKHYGSGGRVSVEAIRQLAGFLALAPVTTRGLLVTSTHVTSVARQYLDEVERTARVRLRVLDGAELSAILRGHPDLVAQYFPASGAVDDLA